MNWLDRARMVLVEAATAVTAEGTPMAVTAVLDPDPFTKTQDSIGSIGSAPPAEEAAEACKGRAAIKEIDGGLPRAEAERGAATLRADEPQRWRGESLDLGDLRPCHWFRNLARTGRCLAAWRGELRADRDWVPTFPGMPQRCIGYKPAADDPDQRPGLERWPDMIAWQGRLETLQ